MYVEVNETALQLSQGLPASAYNNTDIGLYNSSKNKYKTLPSSVMT